MLVLYPTLPEMVDNFCFDMDKMMSADAALFRTSKLNWLLPLNTLGERYCKLEGDNAPSVLDFPTAVRSLLECYVLSIVVRTNITVAANEMEKFEACSKCVLGVSLLVGLVAGDSSRYYQFHQNQ